jgi:chromosome segregation ATPase
LIRWDGEKFVIINVTAAEFTAKTGELAGDILKNTNDIKKLREDVGDRTADEENAFVWLRELQASVNALNELTGLGSGEGVSLTKQIEALVGRLDNEGGLVDRIEALETFKTNTAEDILDHETRITPLETNMGQREEGEAAVYPWLNSLQDSVDDHESRLDAIDGENGTIAAANGRIDGLASRMTVVEDKASANASDIVALKAADTTMGTAISNLQTGLVGANGRLDTLETASTQHGNKIQNLETADTEIKASVKAIDDQLPGIKDDILAAKNAADKANGAIGDANTSGSVKYDIAQLQAKDTLIDADIEILNGLVEANK